MGEAAASGGDLLITGIGQLVDFGSAGLSDPPEILADAFVWIQGGRIAARGPAREIPAAARAVPTLDAGGGVVLPGLVDSHTHAIFGATREHEFERRLAGATYQEIAAAGGGILWSVRDLRARAEDELFDLAAPRLAEFARWGVTTVEVKSGYGLSLEDELRALRIARRLGRDPGLPRVVPTFLGAHAVPDEFGADRAGYVRLIGAGATVALATDFNPGSSMTQNLLLMAAFGCCLMGLTINEALRAVTRGGAQAIGRDDVGSLAPGAAGDVALFDVSDYRQLVYHYGVRHGRATVRDGRIIWRNRAAEKGDPD